MADEPDHLPYGYPQTDFAELPLDRPPPNPSYCPDERYEVRCSAGEITFFAEGRAFELGGHCSLLERVFKVFGLNYRTSFGPTPGYEHTLGPVRDQWLEERKRRRADLKGLTIWPHHQRHWSAEDLGRYADRTYLRADEIELKSLLSSGQASYLMSDCLPLWCKFQWSDPWQGQTYKALGNFLYAVPGEQVSAAVLLEFAFDYCEANGRPGARARWDSTFR